MPASGSALRWSPQGLLAGGQVTEALLSRGSVQALPNLCVERFKQLQQSKPLPRQGCGVGVVASQHHEVIEFQ
jgi:hypothetical protein